MKAKGILFDVTRCIGCGLCYEGCKEQNGLPETNSDFLRDHLSSSTFTVIEEYGDLYTRKLCFHCQHPTCVSVCPVGAFEKTELGPVIYDADKCFGCRYCMQACPHQIPRYEWFSQAPRVRKCTMCYERIKDGNEMTACSDICPEEATQFGDLEDLIAEAKQRIKDNPDDYYPHIYGLEEAGGSNVLILSPVPFEQLGYAGNLPKEALPTYTMAALEKIPHVVTSLGVFLGGMYWLTKRKNQITKEEKGNNHDQE
jgi:formate dehydrogenase iron-sulfur subunit